ncbi:MAG: adenine phosphoribosyltransferase [Ignavibacteriaceae bacterium]
MAQDLQKYIRNVKDFPKKGILFKDVTTLLKEPEAIDSALKQLYSIAKDLKISKVVGIESRGFIFGAMLAEKLHAGFIPIRKPGKLPAETESITYALEYGTDTIQIHKDAIKIGERVLLHDDLLATGGTAQAAAKLIERLGGEVVQISFVIELTALKGRERLQNYDVRSLVVYDDKE